MNVQGPGGVLVNFPDGTDPAIVDKVMRDNFSGDQPNASRASATAQPTASHLPGFLQGLLHALPGIATGAASAANGDIGRNALDGATLGYGDKAIAAGGAALGAYPDYATGLADQRAKSAQAMAGQGPIAGNVERMAGMALPAAAGGELAAGVGALTEGVPLAGRILASPVVQGAETGAALGGADAAGHDQAVLPGVVAGGIMGAGGNLLARGATGALGAVAGKFNPPTIAAPTTADLRAAAQAAYQDSENAGVIISPDALQRLKGTIEQTLGENGYDPALQPSGAAVVNRINAFPRPASPVATPSPTAGPADLLSAPGLPPFAPSAASGPTALAVGNSAPAALNPVGAPPLAGMTLKGLDGLRQIAGLMSEGSPSAGRLGGLVQGNIDDFLNTLHPQTDVVGGNSEEGVNALNSARSLWNTMSKARGLDDAAESAANRAAVTGSGGNIANATRQQILKLMNSRGDWSPDEQAALQSIVDGTPTQNAMRLLGKLSPGGNGLMTALHLGNVAANSLALGPVGAAASLAPPIAGAIAKTLSDRGTAAAVDNLGELIRSGGVAASPAANAVQGAASAAAQPLSNAFMSAGVNASLRNAPPQSRAASLAKVLAGTHPAIAGGLGGVFGN